MAYSIAITATSTFLAPLLTPTVTYVFANAWLEVDFWQMMFTPPMVDHAMHFPEDTVFLTLGRNPRDQVSYEADVVRIEMVTR